MWSYKLSRYFWDEHLLQMGQGRNVSLKTPVEEFYDIIVQGLDGDRYEGDEDCDRFDTGEVVMAMAVTERL